MSSINNNINDNPSKRTSSRAGSLANDEQANSFEARLKRLRTALGVSSDAELARKLGIKQQGVSGVRKKKQLPLTWLITVAEHHSISTDWLLFGEGPMRRGDPCDASDIGVPGVPDPHPVTPKEPDPLGLKISVSDALQMTARVLESGTSYATALFLNIEHFDRAVRAETQLTQMQKHMSDLMGRVAELERVIITLRGGGPPEAGLLAEKAM